jgi:hypothetical protein
MGDHHVDVFGEFPWVVTDERGTKGMLVGQNPAPPAREALTRPVPISYVEELEAIAREARKPLYRRVARSIPPVVWVYRRMKGLKGRRPPERRGRA